MEDKNRKTFSDLLFSSENDSNQDIDNDSNTNSIDNSNISLMGVISSFQDKSPESEHNNNDVSSSSVFSNVVSLNNSNDDVSSKEDVDTSVDDVGSISFDNNVLDSDTNTDNNMFFDTINVSDSSSDNDQSYDNESNFDKEVSSSNDSESSDDIPNNSLEKEMFFDNQESNDFDEKDSSNEDISNVDLGQGIFFDSQDDDTNNDNKAQLLNQNVPSNNIEAELKLINEKKEDVVEDNNSQNPFFEEEESNEKSFDANPLFLNTLNLVESDDMKKKVDVIDPSKSKHFNVKIVRKKEPLFKVIIGVISYAIFIWLLFIGVTLLVYVLDIKIRAYKGDYSTPTYNAYVVLTGSMLPEIQVYDVVVTKKIDAANLKIGDVITFSSADSRFLGTTITHRIIKKNYSAETKSYTFQTKGDNNNVADSALVPQNNIYGKVILKIPKLGYLQEFLASDGGWIIVILIPCLAVISFDIVKLAKGLKRKKYKNIKVQK